MHYSLYRMTAIVNAKRSKFILHSNLKPWTFRHFSKSSSHPQTIVSQSPKTSVDNPKVNLASLSDHRDIVSIKINNEIFKYPTVWLRDNCQCETCFRKGSHSRIINWEKFDFNVKPLSVECNDYELEMEWSDAHKSNFTLEWLKERAFTQEKRRLFRNEIYRFERVTWGTDKFEHYLKRFDYQDVLNDDSILLKWLESLTKYGVAIVSNTPPNRNNNKILVERVAFVRKTHYGEEYVVQAKSGASNVAYLSETLPLHTDLPYYNYQPGVNLLHCIVQYDGDGGNSQLSDGFHVANHMRINHPEEYKILTETLVDWSDIGDDNGNYFHSLHQAPVLCKDEFGDLVRVNFSQPQRDSHFNVPLEQITPWYKAACLFTKLLYSPENFVSFKLAEGEILSFDNHRLVHGRSGYTDSVGKARELIGCYLDWDEIYSRIRVLKKQSKKVD